MVIGGGNDGSCHPSRLKCYVNQENVDFGNIGLDLSCSFLFTIIIFYGIIIDY